MVECQYCHICYNRAKEVYCAGRRFCSNKHAKEYLGMMGLTKTPRQVKK